MERSIASARRVLVGLCAVAAVAVAFLTLRHYRAFARPVRPGYTSLTQAIDDGDATEVERMLKAGADANQRDANGQTLLYQAMVFSWGDERRAARSRRITTALLDAGADPLADVFAGQCVLDANAFSAVDAETLAIVRRRAEAELAARSHTTGPGTRPAARPPLFYGSAFSSIHSLDPLVVRLRLARGADPAQKDESGNTLVHEAVEANRLDLLKLLLDAGAEVNLRNAEGETPLFVACQWDATDAARLLLARGADPYLATMNGMTAVNVQPDKATTQLLGPDVLATASDTKGWRMSRPNSGVEARLRRERVAWRVGDAPSLRADLWSHGGGPYQLSPSPSAITVTLDGRRYHSAGRGPTTNTLTLAPDDSSPGRQSRVQDVRLVLAPADWLAVEDGKPIAWTPGRHTVVAAFNVVNGKGKTVSFETGEAIVEIRE